MKDFFPNLVCRKSFCSIWLTDFISSRDDTSVLYSMDLAETACCWASLRDDRDMRWVGVQNRIHSGIWHRLSLKCHRSNDINRLSSEQSKSEGGEGRKGGKKDFSQSLPAFLFRLELYMPAKMSKV